MENQINVDLQAVINDLLDQIKRLTADNAILRTVVSQLQSAGAEEGDPEVAAAPSLVQSLTSPESE